MEKCLEPKIGSQKGAAVLVISVVLLIAVTLVVIYATQVGLQDQRMSGNEVRHKEAFTNAEAGLDQAAAFLRANPELHTGDAADGWVDCAGSTVFPCDETDAQKVLVSTSTVDASGAIQTLSTSVPIITSNASAFLVKKTDSTLAIGRGVSDDQTGAAVAKVEYVKRSLITPGEIPPVMAPTLNLNGNFTIVANPNNGLGTTGVPISGWTSSNTSGTGSWQTCNAGDYRDGSAICTEQYTDVNDWGGCLCTESLSNKDVPIDEMLDIYTDPTGFPDPFEYIFGPGATVDTIQPRFQESGKYYPGDCTGLDTLDLATLAKPWVWVEGDCDVPSVGTQALPVLLVVEGDMKLNANTEAWGLLISITNVQSNGAAIVHGSLVADGTANISNGGYTQVYDEDLINVLAEDTINTDIGKLKYSWRDF